MNGLLWAFLSFADLINQIVLQFIIQMGPHLRKKGDTINADVGTTGMYNLVRKARIFGHPACDPCTTCGHELAHRK